MPFYSIVVPCYNGARYLKGCLDSIEQQDCDDWEVIAVNDGSTDETLSLMKAYSEQDTRIHVIDKQRNEGLHLARKSGVEAATGSYILFVDADDELAPHALAGLKEALASCPDGYDILHFGVECIAVDGYPASGVQGMSDWLNKDAEPLDRESLLKAIFSKKHPTDKDWNIHHRAFESTLVKKAFAAMTTNRVDLVEDGYEMLVIASCAKGEVTRNDLCYYRYMVGRGVTNSKRLSVDDFVEHSRGLSAGIKALRAFADKDGTSLVGEAVDNYIYQVTYTHMNDWYGRVDDSEKREALEASLPHLPHDAVAANLMRFSRDLAYAALKEGRVIGEGERCFEWYETAERLVKESGCASDEYLEYQEKASSHIWNANAGDGSKLDSMESCRLLTECLGEAYVAKKLLTRVRDEAYHRLQGDPHLSGRDLVVKQFRIAEKLLDEDETAADACSELYGKALSHLSDLERKVSWASGTDPADSSVVLDGAYQKQDIRIFMTTHKNVDMFKSDIIQPVQVGAKTPRRRLLWAYQDDSGENISNLNAEYCELTTQYWAWKNVDAQYYGFCHYRRYFDFSEEEHEENDYGEVMDDFIGSATQAKYCLDDESIRKQVEGFDIITTGIKNLRAFPERFKNPIDQYARAPYLHLADFHRVMDILKRLYPDYAIDADIFLEGHESCFCNMYIMRKEIFFKYCEWMFPILEEFTKGWDTSRLSVEALRTPGHLSERLFNIFLIHEKRTCPNLRCKELQCVHFEHPDHDDALDLQPASGVGMPVVPVVFAADNNYVPMVTTTVYSMLKNADSSHFYDVYVMEKDFSAFNKNEMSKFFSRFPNMRLTFVNVSSLIGAYNLKTSNEHISVETYYRFLIQRILPFYDKVIYLDSDLLVLGDISKLYSIDLGDNLVGAARDIDYLGNLNMNDGERMRYTRSVLKLKDPYGYFQAGVLLLNTAEMRKLYPFQRWLEIAAEPIYIYDDQDILNAHCQGRVTYIDNAWNVMNDCGGRIQKVFTFAPANVYGDYLKAYAHPLIMHYAGFEKPWKPGGCDREEWYWQYARETPFYEILLAKMTGSGEDKALHQVVPRPPRAISLENPLRPVADGILPQGSVRREIAKAIVRKAKGI